MTQPLLLNPSSFHKYYPSYTAHDRCVCGYEKAQHDTWCRSFNAMRILVTGWDTPICENCFAFEWAHQKPNLPLDRSFERKEMWMSLFREKLPF